MFRYSFHFYDNLKILTLNLPKETDIGCTDY